MRLTYRCVSILVPLLLICAIAAPSLSTAGPGDRGPMAGATSALSGAAVASSFELLGSLALDGPASAVAVQGSYAYAGVKNMLVVLNVADPAHPAQLGHLRFPDEKEPINVYSVAIAGRYAYVGVKGGLRVVDVSKPTKPAQVGRYNIPDNGVAPFGSWIQSVVITDQYAYAVVWNSIPSVLVPFASSLTVLDISNPRAPVQVGIHGEIGLASNAVIAGRYAYLIGRDAREQSTFKVLDVTNPDAFQEVGTTLAPADSELALAGNYIYVASESALQVLDIFYPTAPTEVGDAVYDTFFHSLPTLGLADGYAYVGIGPYLRVMDLANPVAPIQEGRYTLPTLVNDLVVANGTIYIVGGSQLFVLRHHPLAITGHVTQPDGRTSVSGVTIAAGATISATTNISGTYQFYDLLDGTYTLTPTLAGYSFWPITQTLTLAGRRVTQDFVLLPGPVETILAPGVPTTLAYTDTQGLRTELAVPAAAVTQTTALRLTPTVAVSTGGYAFAGHAFTMAAERAGHALPELSFGRPLTVTIGYSAADTRVVSDISKLALWRWTGSGWQDAAQDCPPAARAAHASASGTLTTTICRTGRFALFGPSHQVYLPLIEP